jgi:hypothetical protein
MKTGKASSGGEEDIEGIREMAEGVLERRRPGPVE